MKGILVIAEIVDSRIRPETYAAIGCGHNLRNSPDEAISVLVVATDREVLPLLGIADVDEIIHVASGPSSDAVAYAVASLVADRDLRLVLAGQTVNSAGYGARLAVDLGAGFATGVVDVSRDGDALRVTRDVYGGGLQSELNVGPGTPIVLLVRDAGETDHSGAVAEASRPAITSHEAPPSGFVRSRHVRMESPATSDAGFQGARFVIGIGRGIGERANVAAFETLAGRTGAVLGSSRPLVDAGWMTRDRQVGQSGASIDPVVYMAFGISGANEHLAGIRGSDMIVAINTDPRAPIFALATHGVVADAMEVAAALERCWE